MEKTHKPSHAHSKSALRSSLKAGSLKEMTTIHEEEKKKSDPT